MLGTDVFVNLILALAAIASAGVLVAIGLGQIKMEKAERKGLAIGAGIVLVSVVAYIALS
ncbi:hypothetical protein PY365_06000 [Roseiarcaceae bacterium H3SJ34-1]|uniref:hypothetical protein n=1 Tax=Terripilifer ovatus TaxID=3032367 RepID=UPI003AB9B96D|nr:hypothetical protein [Roseiarcaceae bacterium H3SJ34-1]